MITKPLLPPKNGYVEVELFNGTRTYKNINTGKLIENEGIYTLEQLKQKKIYQSKIELEKYLQNNPLKWIDGKFYSITSEKQQWLTSKLFAATVAKQNNQGYTLTWNDSGDICKEWELEDLWNLAFAIDERVTKLVTYQQQKEIEINNCQTQEELDSIIIDYDSI